MTAGKDKKFFHLFSTTSVPVDLNSEEQMVDVIKSCIGTKFMGQYADLACSIAMRAVKTITTEEDGHKEIDVKKWARIEKVSSCYFFYITFRSPTHKFVVIAHYQNVL